MEECKGNNLEDWCTDERNVRVKRALTHEISKHTKRIIEVFIYWTVLCKAQT